MRSDARRRKDPAFWLAINKILMALVVVGLICMVALWFYPELELRNKMVRELDARKAELASEQLLRKQREREVYLLENDRILNIAQHANRLVLDFWTSDVRSMIANHDPRWRALVPPEIADAYEMEVVPN